LLRRPAGQPRPACSLWGGQLGFYGMSRSRCCAAGAVRRGTTRTVTVEPREGHFTTRNDWTLRELPGLLKRYGTVLRGVDGGFINAFGLQRRHPGLPSRLLPTHRDQRTSSPSAGFSVRGVRQPGRLGERGVPAGTSAAVEVNVSCHNVNFDFSKILDAVLAERCAAQPAPGDPQALPDWTTWTTRRAGQLSTVTGGSPPLAMMAGSCPRRSECSCGPTAARSADRPRQSYGAGLGGDPRLV